MDLPRPSLHGTRPAYLDKLFHDSTAPPLPPPPRTSSLGPRSTKSSISSLSSELSNYPHDHLPPRPLKLAPSFETASINNNNDDRISVRSLRLHLSPRFRIRNFITRRTQSEVQETTTAEEDVEVLEMDHTSIRPSTSHHTPTLSSTTKFPSPLRPQTPFTSPKRKGGYWTHAKPPPSPGKSRELHCTPCYYFTARNCNGYVFGGGHGDACENCSALGFLGAP